MAGALTGGAITARGGDGEWFGGGRIAIYTPANSHTGRVSALGGMGAVPGQPGTVVWGLSPTFELVVLPATAGNLRLAWHGSSGLVYQVESSPNLVHWTALGPPLSGVIGWMETTTTLEPVPARFYRVRAGE